MKFRTEITPTPLPRKIGYDDELLMLGSCFADEMRRWLASLKFRASGNFAGPLFNPASIADAIERAQRGEEIRPTDLARGADGRYFSYHTSTLYVGDDPQAVAARCQEANQALANRLATARHLIITFGTAWVYRLQATGEVVANCHKQPQQRFRRERLSVEEIVARWSALLEGPLQKKQVLLTVSPIRHLGDGLEGNAVSKATLRLAVEQLVERCSNCRYFPAYELLLDDLRDYRYYADDLCHPSTQALAYIRERFAEAAFSEQTKQQMKEVEHLLRFCAHRPHDPASEEYQRQSREVIRAMQDSPFDFSEEIALLRSRL